MIYTVPTKRGVGIELWGNYDDIHTLYNVVGKFWNDDNHKNSKEYDNRDALISGFSYELRKCYEASRLKREHSHFSFEPIPYFGTTFSWVHILFALSALRFNTHSVESNKLDLSMFLLLEFWIEKSMNDFDAVGARNLIPFINGGIFSGNKYLYQYMRGINMDYFLLGGGKKAFRKLPDLLKRATCLSTEYKDYLGFLASEAVRLNCDINDLELSDENIDYEGVKW